MRAKTGGFMRIAGSLLLLLYAVGSYAASQMQEVRFHEWSAYQITVELQVRVEADGNASVSVSKSTPQTPQAWAGYHVGAEIKDIKLSDASDPGQKTIIIETTATLTGQAKRYRSYYSNSGKTVQEWGPAVDEASPQVQEPVFVFSARDYPELAKMERVHADETPAEFSSGSAPQELYAPQSGDEEFPDRTFLMEVRGDVLIIKKDHSIVKAGAGTDLEIGDTIKTGENGTAELVLSGTAIIKVSPLSEFVIPQNKANTRAKVTFVQMVKGVLWTKVKQDENSFKVSTPNAVCGVRGTEFNVGYEDGVTWVEVIKGKVWLSEAEGMPETVINAGERASIPLQKIGIAGQWKTDFGTVTFTQSGETVKGTYPHDNGRIEGRLEGNILRGKWSEAPSYNFPHDAGDLEFVFSADQKSFAGKWRYGFDQNSAWSGNWKGTKLENN
jgi:hypothetical protein